MSKRSKIFGLTVSIIATILLEIITTRFINYGWELRLVTSLAWFGSILYFSIDLYWIIRKKFVEYHCLSANMAISVAIVILMCCLAFFGKNSEHRIICIDLMFLSIFIFGYSARKLLNYEFEKKLYRED